jgi:uncharacterized membrane protein (DUF4010 family)
LEFAWKLILSLAIGGLIGLEREKKLHHIIGFRSFALTSFLGMLLTVITADATAVTIGLVGIFALSALYYYYKARHAGRWGITTAIMLPATFVLGVLVGLGYYVEAALAAIAAVYLLVEKSEVHAIVEKVSKNEIVDLLLFAAIAFVIYPQLPSKPADFLGVPLSLQFLWLIVVLITGISFGAYVLLKYLGKKTASIAAFFGGMVSSLAVVAVMVGKTKHEKTTAAVISAASAGSLFSDSILLGIIALPLVLAVFPIMAAFLAAYLVLTVWYSKKLRGKYIHLPHRPLSLKFIAEFSVAFISVFWLVQWTVLNAAPQLLLSSFAGGILSSTSVLAAIAFLYTQSQVTAQAAAANVFSALLGSLAAKVFVSGISTGKWNENLKLAGVVLFLGAVGYIANGFALG